MSKGRLSGDRRKTRRAPVKKSNAKELPEKSAEVQRFVGISLGGGKADKACLAVMEYYPKHKKVFLSRLVEKIQSDAIHSADFKIQEIISEYKEDIEYIAFDVPFRFPNCLECEYECDGLETCPSPHVKWMWEYTRKLHKKKRPRKLFTPYTQRCVEMYVSTELEEPFNMQHAMGSNVAPLLARAMYLKRRWKIPCLEVFPKLSVWRIGRSLNVMKSHLRFHKHSIGGDESRKEILTALSTHNVVFVYDQDVKLMTENSHAFEAFICAFTAFLKSKKMNEVRPDGFPKNEDWVEFPRTDLVWKDDI